VPPVFSLHRVSSRSVSFTIPIRPRHHMLTFPIALQANIKFRIFERHDPHISDRRPRDWSMGLHWGREYLDSMLPPHLRDDLHTISTDYWSETLPKDKYEWAQSKMDMATFPLINGTTGEIVTHVKAVTSRRASRRKVLELFARDLDIEVGLPWLLHFRASQLADHDAKYGKNLVNLHDNGHKVTCTFEDGSSIQTDAVIGCDSGNSNLCSTLLATRIADIWMQCEARSAVSS
jgi:hypothetical protein